MRNPTIAGARVVSAEPDHDKNPRQERAPTREMGKTKSNKAVGLQNEKQEKK